MIKLRIELRKIISRSKINKLLDGRGKLNSSTVMHAYQLVLISHLQIARPMIDSSMLLPLRHYELIHSRQ